MSLTQTLINKLREAQNAHGKAAERYSATLKDFEVTPESRDKFIKKLTDGMSGTIADSLNAGIAAIDSKIEEINKQEAADAERRAKDTEYQQRLSLKLAALRAIDPATADKAALKEYLAEFANDPIAIGAIKGALASPLPEGTLAPHTYRASITFGVLPEDKNGQRQRRLSEFKPKFASVVETCGQLNYSTRGNFVLSVDLLVDNMCDYLRLQEDDFSVDDTQIWSKKAEPQKDNSGAFTFNFKGVREH